MLDRRNFIALGASLPLAHKAAKLDLPDPRLDPFDTGGLSVFSISPDETTLVGWKDREQLAFIDVESGDVISQTKPKSELPALDDLSFAWSPDGTQFAFCLKAWILRRDSDIYVVDVSNGEITNVTPEDNGREAQEFTEAPNAQVDISPVWLDNDTLLFARHTNPIDESFTAELMTLVVSTGELVTLVDLAVNNIRWVSSRIWKLTDNTLVFLVDFSAGNHRRGVVRVTPDGDITEIHAGVLEYATLWNVSDTHLVFSDAQSGEWFYAPVDESADPVLLWERFLVPDGWTATGYLALGNEPDSLVAVLRSNRDTISPYLFRDDSKLLLAELRGEYDARYCEWFNDWMLVAGESNCWLVPIESVPSHNRKTQAG